MVNFYSSVDSLNDLRFFALRLEVAAFYFIKIFERITSLPSFCVTNEETSLDSLNQDRVASKSVIVH